MQSYAQVTYWFARTSSCARAISVLRDLGLGYLRVIRLFGLGLAAARAGAQDQELAKLVANDGAPGDRCGYAVAVANGRALVGARERDELGQDSGCAYLFDVTEPRAPVQLAKLLAPDGAAGDLFGTAVAISDGTALVGALGHDSQGESAGAAYLFEASTGAFLAKLVPPNGAAMDRFGISVAASGGLALVGAHGDDGVGDSSGAVHLFDISDPRYPAHVATLAPRDAGARQFFGGSVSIDGAWAAVGASGDDERGEASGAAYVFDLSDPARPVERSKCLLPWAAEHYYLGVSVGISGSRVIAGTLSNEQGHGNPGGAYIYEATTGELIAHIDLPDYVFPWDRFGASVAIWGGTAAVGAAEATGNFDLCGAVYLYDAATGVEAGKLWPHDCTRQRFGGDIAMRDGLALIGADFDDQMGAYAGATYIFGACRVDLASDGTVDIRDLVAFLDAWARDERVSDWNRDGEIRVDDVQAYLGDWMARC